MEAVNTISDLQTLSYFPSGLDGENIFYLEVLECDLCDPLQLGVPLEPVHHTGDAVISFHRDTFSTCRYCACAKHYFTVCIIRCDRAELILGR